MASTKRQDAHSRPGLPTHIAKVFAAGCLLVGFLRPTQTDGRHALGGVMRKTALGLAMFVGLAATMTPSPGYAADAGTYEITLRATYGRETLPWTSPAMRSPWHPTYSATAM